MPAIRSAMMRSGFTPSASAVKLVTTRCRSTDGATARTSSMPGANRPCRTARVLAPRTRYCDARGDRHPPHELLQLEDRPCIQHLLERGDVRRGRRGDDLLLLDLRRVVHA